MQGEQWMMVANSCHKLHFADSRATQFSQAAVPADGARTNTHPSLGLPFLKGIFGFSSPQVPTRRKYWRP